MVSHSVVTQWTAVGGVCLVAALQVSKQHTEVLHASQNILKLPSHYVLVELHTVYTLALVRTCYATHVVVQYIKYLLQMDLTLSCLP